MVAAIAAAAPTQAHSAAAASGVKLGGDFSTFLSLLTTQLKNQDPTNAMDPTEVTNQLVSFSQIEQEINTNSNLEKMISLQQTSALTTASNLVGQRVELSGNALPLQNGAATLLLPAAGTARQAHVQVQDQNGAVLYDTTVPLGSDGSTWTWDGRTLAGRQLPDGAYSYAIEGLAADGSKTPLSATARGTVTGVERQNGDLQLAFGSALLGFDKVTRVDAR